MTPPTRLSVIAVALVAALGSVPAPASATAAKPAAAPHVRGTATVPVYDYATAIRESVWVDTPLDNDGDGLPDRVAVDLIRPREAAQAGVRVPVIMDASPYYQCCGRGNESETKVYAADGTVTRFPLFYDNYFVPRGYAFAAVDLAGTARSTGCGDVGGREEILSVKAAIDWLNGRAVGRRADGTLARADWTTGKVGMIGKSWDGTLANGVAATGVDGLATIVPIAGISSWYDYYRDRGAVYTNEFGPSWLSGYVNGRPTAVCAPLRAALKEGQGTGSYNAFWAERDYLPNVRKVKASVFVVHGINDLNVETKHFAQWWDALAARGVPRKIWLSQEGHVDPFDFRREAWVPTLHRWFDYWLQGLHNGVLREPAATIERAPDQWVDEPTWPAPGTFTLPVSLRPGPGAGTLGLLPARPGAVQTVTDNPALREAAAVTDPNTAKAGRLAFLSAPLPGNLRISGTPTISLRVRVNRPTTELSARLVDYGRASRIAYQAPGEGIRTLATESCFGASTAADNACYFETAKNVVTADQAILTRGWTDAAHRDSLTNPSPLLPDKWYTVTWKLHAHDAVLPAGRVLGLVVSLTDSQYTEPPTTGATVEVDLGRSRLNLPISFFGTRVPAGGALAETTTAPQVATDATLPEGPARRFEQFR